MDCKYDRTNNNRPDCTSDVGVTCKKMRSGLHDLNPVVRKTYMSDVEAFCRARNEGCLYGFNNYSDETWQHWISSYASECF